MNPEIPQALYERAIGHQIQAYVKTLRVEDLATFVNAEALNLLSEIKDILDDETMEDPECFYRVDALVEAFRDRSIHVKRHDW